jgi:3-isopropylmalate/(R)-2-methylmalate dehydratase large subunit
VDQVYVGNCANGTLTDLRQVAEVLRGRQVAPHVRMVVVPATQRIWRQALAEGLLDIFAEAGAAVSTPTCGACFGGHMGILAAGEVAVATTNRNYRGRMGHPESAVYLANAWVAAAAAVAGEIVPPEQVLGAAPGGSA